MSAPPRVELGNVDEARRRGSEAGRAPTSLECRIKHCRTGRSVEPVTPSCRAAGQPLLAANATIPGPIGTTLVSLMSYPAAASDP